jgi:hypothetical protein
VKGIIEWWIVSVLHKLKPVVTVSRAFSLISMNLKL